MNDWGEAESKKSGMAAGATCKWRLVKMTGITSGNSRTRRQTRMVLRLAGPRVVASRKRIWESLRGVPPKQSRGCTAEFSAVGMGTGLSGRLRDYHSTTPLGACRSLPRAVRGEPVSMPPAPPQSTGGLRRWRVVNASGG